MVGYNVDFDLKMLQAGEVYPSCAKTFDVMKEYARLLPNGRWVKLIECAHNYGYDYVPHDSLNDVRATLHCYKKLLQDSRYIELINRQEQKKKEDESKRTNYKTTSVFLFIASAFLLFSSCSISQSFSGTLGIIGLSIFLFFAGIIFWALGSE